MEKRGEKHGPNATISSKLERAVKEKAKNNELPCAVAFVIVDELNEDPAMVGRAVDLCDFALVKCQLGLFGYKPKKKILKPAKVVLPEMEKAVTSSVYQGRISCARCWEIAKELDVPKMSVSAACDAMSIKIKPCQLGAF